MGNSESARTDPDDQYDSTWEDEDDRVPPKCITFPKRQTRHAHRDMHAAKDMQNYRRTCQRNKYGDSSEDHGGDLHNLEFYHNKIPSQPDKLYIEDFHKHWPGNYKKLENVHSYIQWLFPIQEQGMNKGAHILTLKEIKLFCNDENAKASLSKSYELMLNFYGIKLLDERTGRVDRAENWKERFENLDRNTHNNLRITRILKCLGILGFQHFQAPLVRFFLQETLVNGELPRVKQSVLDYFMFAVLDKSERTELIRFAFQNFEPKQEFVWCPQKIQKRFLREMKKQNQTQTEQNTIL